MIFSETVGYFLFLFPVRSDLSVVALLALPFPRKREGTWVLCVSISICCIIYFI